MRNIKRVLLASTAALTICLLIGAAARAYINPGYTPATLVDQADCILELKLVTPIKGDKITAKIIKTLRVKKAFKKMVPEKEIIIDLSITAMQDHAKKMKQKAQNLGKQPVLFFMGTDQDENEACFIHMMGRWYSMDPVEGKKNEFDLNKEDAAMEGVWAGGTDMLKKIVELLIKEPETDVPVVSGVAWDKHTKVAVLKGRVHDSRALTLSGKVKRVLYLACDDGDRLYSCPDLKITMKDITAERKLSAKSKVAVWTDFNGDAKLDLGSWDGKAFKALLQQKDGSFAAAAAVSGTPAGKCLGILVVESGTPGRPGLLWSTESGPLLLKPGKGLSFSASKLEMGDLDVTKLGSPGRCLLGDLTGDNLPDVLFPLSKASVLFLGTGAGTFAKGIKCNIALGEAPGSAFFGDYDMDGRLDVFCVGKDGCLLWHNRPGKKPQQAVFTQSTHISGELAYISKPGGIWGNTCDINNDGRQDPFWVYSLFGETGPHIFFNRGFRSFGHSHSIDITERTLLNRLEATIGQQHGIIADFNNDGGQDMAVILNNGELYFFPREVEDEAYCVNVALPAGGKVTGPVRVTASYEGNSMGAWNVATGTDPAFFGLPEVGIIKISWQLPGQKAVTKTIKVIEEEEPVWVTIK
jgi:FG-GAP-like repeat